METTTPDWDRIYQAMAQPVRRAVVEAVLEGGKKASIDDIVAQLCDDDADEQTVTRVASSLHHVHLPVLAEVGLVTYDSTEKYAQPTDTAGQLPLFLLRPRLSVTEPASTGQRADD